MPVRLPPTSTPTWLSAHWRKPSPYPASRRSWTFRTRSGATSSRPPSWMRFRRREVNTRWPCSSPAPTRTGGLQDVGGTRTMQITTFSIHGSRPFDQRLMVNGITSRNFLSSAWASNFVPDMGTAAEIVVDYSSGTADSVGGGMGINVIPKEGGNKFVGSFFITGANGSFQGNNYHRRTEGPGVVLAKRAETRLRHQPVGRRADLSRQTVVLRVAALPGKLATTRRARFANANGGDLTKWTYVPDSSKPGVEPVDDQPQRECAADLSGHATQQDRAFRPSRRTGTGSMG